MLFLKFLLVEALLDRQELVSHEIFEECLPFVVCADCFDSLFALGLHTLNLVLDSFECPIEVVQFSLSGADVILNVARANFDPFSGHIFLDVVDHVDGVHQADQQLEVFVLLHQLGELLFHLFVGHILSALLNFLEGGLKTLGSSARLCVVVTNLVVALLISICEAQEQVVLIVTIVHRQVAILISCQIP